MPLYEYECLVCGRRFELLQSMGDHTPKCPEGHADVKRCFCPPRIVFKGKGFYVTDTRGARSGNRVSPK